MNYILKQQGPYREAYACIIQRRYWFSLLVLRLLLMLYFARASFETAEIITVLADLVLAWIFNNNNNNNNSRNNPLAVGPRICCMSKEVDRELLWITW